MIASVALAAVLAAPATSLPGAWQHWRYERPIQTSREGPQTIVIPPSIYATARPSLRDLRIIDEAGAGVPFAIIVPPPRGTEARADARLTDEGYVSDRYAQAVAHVPAGFGEYDALEILTSLTDFAARVDVDASDDGITWRTIRTAAPIYDYRQDGLASNMRVNVPASTATFLRARVRSERVLHVIGIRVTRSNDPAAQTARYPVQASSPREDPAAHTTTIVLSGLKGVPISELRVDSQTPRFSRTVDLQAEGTTGWFPVASATITRAGAGQAALTLDFPESHAARWRVVIHNGDNSALRDIAINAFGAPRRLYFDAETRHRYLLIYGNTAASAPQFDYAATHSTMSLHAAAAAALMPMSLNATFVSGEAQKPWTERHPWVLWSALGVAVIAIGALAVRTIAEPRT